MTFANILTLLRLIFIPFVLYAVLEGRSFLAFFLFMASGLTDALDGFVARKFNQKTQLGAIIDPLADKSLMISVFIVLTYMTKIPVFLTVLVIMRDLQILAGVAYLRLTKKTISFSPLSISKANTFLQISYILTVLAKDLEIFPFLPLLIPFIMWLLVLTTCVSSLLYIQIFVKILTTPKK